MPVEIFICYARRDQPLLKELLSHLMPLQRQELIKIWSDIDINAGKDWEKEIEKHLNSAQIILLLVSPDFIKSDYCYSVEMKRAMERHERGEAIIVPVILRPVRWQGTPFAKIQALPTDVNPITMWPDRDAAFLNVIDGLVETIKELSEQSAQAAIIASRSTLYSSSLPVQAHYFLDESHRQNFEKLLRELRDYDIHPLYLPDIEDMYPEAYPIYPLRDKLVADLRESLLAASDDEVQATYDTLDAYFKEQVDFDLLLQRGLQAVENMATFLLVTLLRQRYYDLTKYLSSDGNEQSNVLKTYPELAQFENEDGLIPFGTPHFVPAGVGGGVYYKEHLLLYHQLLRRNFTANLNFRFLNALAEYYKNHRDQFVAVAIDHFRLMPKEVFSQMFEKDRSFGPPLALSSLDDPQAVGLTVHTLQPRFIPLHGYERTEFYWAFRDGYKTFQAEEVYSLAHIPNTSKEYVLTRSVYAVRDIENHTFTHLDGSITVYLREHYDERHGKTIQDIFPREKQIKVFQIDGNIADNDWSKLIGYFYQQNVMVAEYLNPNFLQEG